MRDRITRRSFIDSAARLGLASQLTLGSAALAATAADAARPRRASFDGNWRFARGDFPGAEQPSFADGTWTAVDLPHDWSIAGPFDKDAPSGGAGGYLPTGIGWYRKSFVLPDAPSARRVRVQFDGVYQRSDVWINGRHLGFRPNGFVSFVYDLTPYLSRDGQPNMLAVRVDNSLQPNCRWYSGSGIYRHTWLTVTDPVHIAPWGVFVRTSRLSSQEATIGINVRIANQGESASTATLDLCIVDRKGRAVASTGMPTTTRAGEERSLTQHLGVPKPDLWSPSTPSLYTLEVSLRDGARVLDAVTTSFGIRDITFDADRGCLVNGEGIKLNGVCLHGDGGAVGTAVPERIWERRLAKLKEMGCNAIRCSHNPPAPGFLDLCDAMGFLVMGEPFDEWRQAKLQTPLYGYHKYFNEWAAHDLTSTLMRDRNHPSIALWSAGNEVPDQTDPAGPQTLQSLLDIFHRMDPQRPVTVACDNIAAEPKPTLPAFLEKFDVVGYNYVDRWRDRREKFYSIDRQAYPRRKFIGTESVAMGGVRGAYRLSDDPPVFGEWTSNRRIEVEQLQKFVQTYDYVSGDFMWTGIDYLGESFWPSKLAPSGVLDTCGFEKDRFYFYQSIWTDKPVLHLFPHWNWAGLESQTIAVTCYTNCDTVELFLNDKSLGVKGFAFPRPGMTEKYGTYPPRATALQMTADLHLAWDVPYAPGTLRAVGTRDGNVVATSVVPTTGAPSAIRLSVDRNRIETGRHDVAHVRMEIVDSRGRLVPTADNKVTFAVRGAGRIIGLDSGRPDSHEAYQATRRVAFNGLVLALLQSSGDPGRIILSAEAPSLAPAEIEIVCA